MTRLEEVRGLPTRSGERLVGAWRATSWIRGWPNEARLSGSVVEGAGVLTGSLSIDRLA
ncbi:MAG: hypothetical protein AABM30_06060 [Actinomycetota bacterium]